MTSPTLPYDGLRPKNAICTRCGYQFGGTPIVGSSLVCPECGHVSAFELVKPAHRRPRTLLIALLLLVSGSLVVLVSLADLRAGLLMAGVFVGLWLLLVAFRRQMLE